MSYYFLNNMLQDPSRSAHTIKTRRSKTSPNRGDLIIVKNIFCKNVLVTRILNCNADETICFLASTEKSFIVNLAYAMIVSSYSQAKLQYYILRQCYM